MKKLIIALVVLFALGLQAQETPQSKAAILATTDDGRRVVLMPDGKWSFVEGQTSAPPKAEKEKQDKLWDAVYSYLSSNFEIENMEKDSLFIQTKWKTLPFFYMPIALVGSAFDERLGEVHPGMIRGKVAVKIQEKCPLKIDTIYQVYDGDLGWTELQRGRMKGIPKKLTEFDNKLKTDMNALCVPTP